MNYSVCMHCKKDVERNVVGSPVRRFCCFDCKIKRWADRVSRIRLEKKKKLYERKRNKTKQSREHKTLSS